MMTNNIIAFDIMPQTRSKSRATVPESSQFTVTIKLLSGELISVDECFASQTVLQLKARICSHPSASSSLQVPPRKLKLFIENESVDDLEEQHSDRESIAEEAAVGTQAASAVAFMDAEFPSDDDDDDDFIPDGSDHGKDEDSALDSLDEDDDEFADSGDVDSEFQSDDDFNRVDEVEDFFQEEDEDTSVGMIWLRDREKLDSYGITAETIVFLVVDVRVHQFAST
jgi:hypothetical protein